MEEKKKNNKIFLIIALILLIILILLGIIIFYKLNDNNILNINVKKNIDNINRKIKTVSFKQMDYSDDSLTEDQKLLAKFFDEDYFFVYSYEEMVRYADMLKGINISCYAGVDSILSSDSENFEAVCQWEFYQEGLWGEFSLTNPIIIKGKKPEKMIIEKDLLTVKGKLIGAETRNINGENKYLPVIEVIEIGGESCWHNDDTIRRISKLVFGNNIKIRKPTDDEIYNMVMNYDYGYQDYFLLVEFENQSNLNFKCFDIWKSTPMGLITYNALYNQGMEKDISNRRLYITPDLQKYIVFDMSIKDKYVYINVYDRNLNKLWSKEISNASQITWDSTNENLIFISDNDFYNINIENGENIFDSVYVGKRTDVRIIDNGFIILSDDTDDAIMFLDDKGNIKNKYDIKIDDSYSVIGTYIQKLDNKYIILYNLFSEGYRGSPNYKSKYIIIDQNGNKLNESE